MVIKFSECTLQLQEVWDYLTEAESKGSDIEIAELKQWILASHEKMMTAGRKRADFRKCQNDVLITNMEKDVTEAQVKAKVEKALTKVARNEQIPEKTVASVKKLPRNKGTKADLFKVTLGTDKIVDKQGKLCYPNQKLISGISSFNGANRTQKLFASAFIPTCVKDQGSRLNDLARRIREKNKTNKWFTRLVVSQKELRLILKVKGPGKDSKWCELSTSKLPAAFLQEYKEILELPIKPYIPAKAKDPSSSAPSLANDQADQAAHASQGSSQVPSSSRSSSPPPPPQMPKGERRIRISRIIIIKSFSVSNKRVCIYSLEISPSLSQPMLNYHSFYSWTFFVFHDSKLGYNKMQ